MIHAQTQTCTGTLSLGSLIQLQGTSLVSQFYFISQAMKKPQSQVLIQGFLLDGPDRENVEVSIIHPELQRPVFMTSHQLFVNIRDVCASTTTPTAMSIESIPFVIHEYRLNPWKPLLQVSLTSVTDGHAFSSRVSTQVKRPPRVAFGLKKSPRKRKARVKGTPAKKASEATASGAPHDMPAVPEAFDGHAVQKMVEQFAGTGGLPSSHPGSDDGSQPSVAPDSSSSESSGEEPFQPADAAREQREVESVLESHRKLMQARGDMFNSDGVAREGAADEEPHEENVEPAPSQPSDKSRTTATFCNSRLGLVGIGTQQAARLAKCRHCNQPIERGSVRFAYSYHKQKFAAWIHARCIAAFLRKQKAQIINQAISFVNEMAQREQPANVLEAIGKLQRDLKA